MTLSDGGGFPLCASVGALSFTATTLNALLARCGTGSHRNLVQIKRTAKRSVLEATALGIESRPRSNGNVIGAAQYRPSEISAEATHRREGSRG